jgi:hypothetical protein
VRTSDTDTRLPDIDHDRTDPAMFYPRSEDLPPTPTAQAMTPGSNALIALGLVCLAIAVLGVCLTTHTSKPTPIAPGDLEISREVSPQP